MQVEVKEDNRACNSLPKESCLPSSHPILCRIPEEREGAEGRMGKADALPAKNWTGVPGKGCSSGGLWEEMWQEEESLAGLSRWSSG